MAMVQRTPTRNHLDRPRKDEQCYRCTREFPIQNNCRAKEKTCHKCGTIGNFATHCKSAKPPQEPNGVRPQQRRRPDKSQLKQQGKVVRQVDHTQPTRGPHVVTIPE